MRTHITLLILGMILPSGTGTVFAAACPTGTQMTLPTMEQPGDYTLPQLDATECAVFRNCPGTQFGKAMVEDGLSAAMAGVMALTADVPGCAAAMKPHWEGLYGCISEPKAAVGGSCRSVFNTFDTTHPYYDATDQDFSNWARKDGCTDYSKKHYALTAAHKCLTSAAGKLACAKSLLATANTLYVAAIKIEGGACVDRPGCMYGRRPDGEPCDTTDIPVVKTAAAGARGLLGVLTTKCLDGKKGFDARGWFVPCKTINVPPLTADDKAKLQATVDAHAVHTEEVNGHHVDYHGPGVNSALLAWMAGARTEAELAMRRLEPFPRGNHPQKSITDQATLLRLAHDLWIKWAACEVAQDWRCATRFGKAHRETHVMLMMPPEVTNYYVTLPWDDRPMEDQPVLTMAAVIEKYRAEHPAHVEELKHLGEMH